jgi:hypothetical protein
MSKYTEKQITIAQVSFEAGDSLREASRKSNIPETTLRRYAKKLFWVNGKWRTYMDIKASAVKAVLATEIGMAQNMGQMQKQLCDEQILNLAGLRLKAEKVLYAFLDLMHEIVNKAHKTVSQSKNGLYIKSKGYNSISYGRLTEFIKDLVPSMQLCNTILGLDECAVNVSTRISGANKQAQVILNIIRADSI